MSCASLPYMSICTRVIITITFKQIYNAKNCKTTAYCNDNDLEC